MIPDLIAKNNDEYRQTPPFSAMMAITHLVPYLVPH